MPIQFSGTAGAVTVSELNPDIVSKPSLGGCGFTASATGSNLVIADSANLNPGKNSFSIGPVRVYNVTDGNYNLIDKLSGNNGWRMTLNASTGIMALVVGTGSTTLTATCSAVIPGILSGTIPLSELMVTVTRGASTASVLFYCNGVQLGAAQTINLTADTVVTSTAAITVFDKMAWAIFSTFCPIWNYAMPSDFVSKIFMYSATTFLSSQFRFKWGSMTNTTTTENSTFVGGTTGNWAVVNSTCDVVNNELRWTLPASAASEILLQCNQTPSQFSAGYYNVYFKYKLSSGTALELTINRTGTVDVIGKITPTSDWQIFTGQFQANGGGAIRITTPAATANESVYLFDDFETTYSGCVCAYDGNPNGYQWHDIGTGKHHATLGVNAYPLSVNRTNVLRYSSSTSGTEFMLGSDRVCLPTNHVITSIYAYTTGTPTIDIGTAASAADIASSQVLSAGWNDISLSNMQSSTYKLNVTSSTADTIVWNINYMILLP